MDKEEHSSYISYTLNGNYFVNKDTFYKNLHQECKLDDHKSMCLCKKVIPSFDFCKKIKEEEIIYQYYENSIKNLQEKDKIHIVENGLFVLENKMLLYCVKNEKIEDDYLADVKNIKCIDHNEYDKSKSKSNSNKENKDDTKSNDKDNNVFNKSDNNSFKSNSKYEKDSMTGLKNRALVLESLVNYYFRQFPILSLPNIIINLDYKSKFSDKNKSKTEINLFFEWDGCYLFEGKDDITFSTDFILPFNKEIKYKINRNKNIEKVQNDILIRNNSIVLIEVKTHFPKENEDDHDNNLENVIKIMFTKLNYFVPLYKKILKKNIKEIKMILLYDQNRLKNYKSSITNYLEQYKQNYKIIDQSELYFDIIYIIPSIGKLSLNHINQQLFETKQKIKQLENNNQKLIQLEVDNKKLK